MLTASIVLVGGTLVLWVAAEALVRGSSALGARAGISPIVIGLTVVSIGTSAPELVVCVTAALGGSPDIAVGNVLGSNLANIGLILGIAVLLRPLDIAGQVVAREIPWMLFVTAVLLPFLFDLRLTRLEGAVLAVILLVYLYLLVPVVRRQGRQVVEQVEGIASTGGVGYPTPILMVLAGSVGLVVGGRGIVYGATEFAALLAVPEMLVGLSVVAVGTSLPELATSVVAALRHQGDLAVGNIVGSNIFNLTFVLGTTAVVSPLTVDPGVLRVEYPAVVILSCILIPLLWTKHHLGRTEGIFLLVLYGAAWVWVLLARGI